MFDRFGPARLEIPKTDSCLPLFCYSRKGNVRPLCPDTARGFNGNKKDSFCEVSEFETNYLLSDVLPANGNRNRPKC